MPRKKQFNESEVLDKAVNLFWEKGFNGTSVQDLVDRLGINRASMYDTYGDKEELFLKALARYQAQNWESMCALLDSGIHPRKLIAEIFDLTISSLTSCEQNKGCFVVNCSVELAPHDANLAKSLDQRMDDMVGKLTSIFESGTKKGEISPKHTPEQLAFFVYNTLNGMNVIAKVRPDKKVFTGIKEVTLAALG